MFTRSVTRLTLALVIVGASLMLITSFTITAATPTADARPQADLIVNPGQSIQAAIDAAKDGDTILVNAGNYTESLTLSKPVSLTGVNSDTTIIHAVAGQRVLTVTGATISNSVVISGLTFTDGYADFGGGIYADVPLTIMSSRFISNSAINGGGLYIIGLALLSDVRFENNTAYELGGGVNVSNGILDLRRAAFIHNIGNAIFSNNSPATIIDSHFEQNSAPVGGAIRMYAAGANISHTDFISNTATLYDGGAVMMFDGNIVNSRFERNTSQVLGGALMARNLFMSNTLLISNTSGGGGGAWVLDNATIIGGRFENNQAHGTDPEWSNGGGLLAESGSLVVSGTQFIGNSAVTNGGGLSAESSAILTNVEFISNTSLQTGGGAFISGTATLIDTDFISNTAFEGGGGYFRSPVVISNAQFISNYAGCTNAAADCGGGGLYTADSITITNTRFISNTALRSGGGLYATDTGALYNTRFEDNTVIAYGGGMFALIYDWIISDSMFTHNAAYVGGGIYGSSLVLLANTAFVNNVAAVSGGVVARSVSDTLVINALFAGNTAPALNLGVMHHARILHTTITNPTLVTSTFSTEGILLSFIGTDPHIEINNTIVGNHGFGIAISGPPLITGTVTEDYNLYYGNITNIYGLTMGAHSLVGDPKFIDSNSGNYALRFGSAAIDSGVDAGISFDINGISRPQGHGFDIGAYEYHGLVSYYFLPIIRK